MVNMSDGHFAPDDDGGTQAGHHRHNTWRVCRTTDCCTCTRPGSAGKQTCSVGLCQSACRFNNGPVAPRTNRIVAIWFTALNGTTTIIGEVVTPAAPPAAETATHHSS
jgi:hypothetical protein